ncbi:MAG: hypothetical protein ACI835_002882 [Planctomycetota bacterium]|jgi:hypothetical protein
MSPTLDDVIDSVGIASRNQLGTNDQVENAHTPARLEIARMLEARVQDVGRRDIEQNLSINGDGDLAESGSHKSLLGVDSLSTPWHR